MQKWVKLISIAFFLIFVDVLSKYYTTLYISKMSWLHPFYPYGGIAIFKNFLGISLSLNYVENIGAAWGMLANYSEYLLYVRILIVIGILLFLTFSRLSFKKALPYILICSGAIGNILDHFFYGHVVDMIHFKFGSYSYPVFNLADSMITIGIVWLLVSIIFSKKGTLTCK